MNRTEKEAAVGGLSTDLQKPSAIFAMDFRGLKVEQATELRRKIRETGSKYKVVKNTLALRAIEGTFWEPMRAHLDGMTSLAYTDTDPVALAKVLNDFSKDVSGFRFKGGIVSGKEVSPEECQQLASLPGRDELTAKLLYVLQAPIQQFVGLLQAPARDLVLVLKAAEESKQ